MDIAVEEAVKDKIGSSQVAAGTKPSKAAPEAETAGQAQFPSSVGAQLVGQIVGLLIQSPTHRHLFLADLEWLIGPAMALRQFRIFHHGNKPVAVALWASVSDEVGKELAAGRARLRPEEWKSGNNIWLIDLIAPSIPYGSKAAEELLKEIGSRALKGRGFKIRTLDAKTGKLSVHEFPTPAN